MYTRKQPTGFVEYPECVVYSRDNGKDWVYAKEAQEGEDDEDN